MKAPLMAAVLTLGVPLGVHSASAGEGEELHKTHCKACHVGMTGGDGSLLYTRDDRRVKSLAALQAQVRRCEQNLELRWFDDQLNQVVTYLNETYYKFPTP